MGLPSFTASDLDTGPVSAVVACVLALRDQFLPHAGEGWNCSVPQNGRKHGMELPRRENGQVTQNFEVTEDSKQMETMVQKVSKSPAVSEPLSPKVRPGQSSISRHAGHNFHEVFQLRQGGYFDLPSCNISEMMKSTSMDNAPTQSLLSVVNGILDEIIERKIGEIPYQLSCLLRRIVLEIERRISTQAEHIRNQNNLMKAREEKYKSRIRVLEALASGNSGQIHVSSSATNDKEHVNVRDSDLDINMEKDKLQEKRRLVEEDLTKLIKDKENVTRLTKDKEDMARLLNDKEDIIRLMKEKEEMARLIKAKEDRVSLKKGKDEDRDQSANEPIAKPIVHKDELISLMKDRENNKNTIMRLKLELEATKSSYEESHSLLESKKEDVLKLLKDKENSDNVISQLRQELAIARRSHETYIQELKTTALQENRELEYRIKEVELKLEHSTNRGRYLEDLLESRIQTWEQKEIMLNQFVGLQVQNIQDLRLSSVSIKHEILNCQKSWSEELSGLGQSLKVLTSAAENYHATLEENRKLFNEVQELKGNIRVFCRIRPFLPNEDHKSSTTELIGDNGELILANPTKTGKEGSKLFKFNKVLGPTSSQDEVFKDIQPLIRSVLDGYNVCIFAYGQTGSGKTCTMTGPENATEEELGVNFRALNDLFLISRNRGDTIMYDVSVQMIEIYNEQIRDLLGSKGSEKKYPFVHRLTLIVDIHLYLFCILICFHVIMMVFINLHTLEILNASHPSGLAVPDATIHPVNSTSDVIELIRTGLGNRAVGATALNERSSRSHSVVTVHIQGVDLKTGATLRGALHLVDLAGSERVDRSAVTGDRLKEAQHINKSLSALGDVIFSLSQKTSHIPYRNSKLTQVLQSSLGGHAKTLMFVQINPDVSSYAEFKYFELSLLKDKIAKKDEEINQLQTHTPRTMSGKRADSLLKRSSSSSGISYLGSKIQHRRTASCGKALGFVSRGSDADNFSEISDRHSEASSMQSVDDIHQQSEIMALSKLSEDETGPNSADPEIDCFGYADSEGRLSDISDSGLSMGTETDGSVSSMVEYALFPEQEKNASTWKEQKKAPNTPIDRL
ncbi:hypothetical protein ACQ4PT_015595 [Festuca glaucescens]